MQEKVYQAHIANIDELKHPLVQVQLDQRHIAAAIYGEVMAKIKVTCFFLGHSV